MVSRSAAAPLITILRRLILRTKPWRATNPTRPRSCAPRPNTGNSAKSANRDGTKWNSAFSPILASTATSLATNSTRVLFFKITKSSKITLFFKPVKFKSPWNNRILPDISNTFHSSKYLNLCSQSSQYSPGTLQRTKCAKNDKISPIWSI